MEIHSLNKVREYVEIVFVECIAFEFLDEGMINHLENVLLPFNNNFELIFFFLFLLSYGFTGVKTIIDQGI